MHDNTKMSDIDSFVSQLLASSPGARYSVQLDLDTEDVQGVFEFMLTVMTTIMRTWYTPPISLEKVTETDLTRLTDYFASFGMRFSMEAEESPRVLQINNREYLQKSRLEDMKFQMASRDSMLYTVRFSNLPTM